jgi:hypothetical protein
VGNLVLMAVRHNDLDAIEKLSIKEIEHAYMHRPDDLPKLFDGNESWIGDKDRFYDKHLPNVVMSQYYHYSGSPLLYVDDNMMASVYDLGVSRESKETGFQAFDFEAIAPSLKKRLRKNKVSLLARPGKISRPKRTGFKVSLFILWTDSMDRVEGNEHVMTDVVHFCRTGEVRGRTFGSLNKGIDVLATIDGDKAALIPVCDFSHTVFVMDRFEMTTSTEEQGQIDLYHHESSYMKASSLQDLILTREIAAAHGYLVQETKGAK